MKKTVLLAFMLVLAAATQAQEDYAEDFSFPVQFKGKSPTISDFVTALVTCQEDPGESLAYIGRQWKKRRQGQPYDGQFTVDTRHGYVRYDQQIENTTSLTEFCYWKCADKRKMVVAVNASDFRDGVAFAGQFAGVSFYLYDTKTRRMAWVSSSGLGVEHPDINTFLVYTLPVRGKDIHATANDPEKGECKFVYVWNGKGFNLQTE